MNSQPTWQPGMTLEYMERQIIFSALKFYLGNKERTASALGIDRKTLYLKLEKYENSSDFGLAKEPQIETNQIQANLPKKKKKLED